MNAIEIQALSEASLAPAAQDMAPAMALALSSAFGSVAGWREQYAAMSAALAEQPGWALLSFVPVEGRLVNQLVAGQGDAPAGSLPVLALQGAGPAELDRIDWPQVYERYQHAVHASSDAFAADRSAVGSVLLLDVRRAGVFEQAPTMLPGARWQDPALVSQWATELPAGREVLVYCIYGHEVGRSTAMRLRALGVDARFLPGGIDGWQKDGLPVQPKQETAKGEPS